MSTPHTICIVAATFAIQQTFMWESKNSLSSLIKAMYGMWTCCGISHIILNPHDSGCWIALELSNLIRQLMQMVFQDSESNLRCKSYSMSRWRFTLHAYKSMATYHSSLRNCPMSLQIQKPTIVVEVHVYLTDTIVQTHMLVMSLPLWEYSYTCAPNCVKIWT